MHKTRAACVSVLAVLCLSRLAAAQTASQKDSATIRSSSRLVLVDLIVTNKHGEAVRDLRQDEVTLLEDGAPVKLVAFSMQDVSSSRDQKRAPLPEHVYTNRPEYNDPGGPLTVVLLDGLNTPIKDQVYAREQVLKYFGEQQDPKQRIAVLGLGPNLNLLQDFTNDPAALRAAMQKAGIQLSNFQSDESQVQDSDHIINRTIVRSDPALFNIVDQAVRQFLNEGAVFGITERVDITLHALRNISRWLAGYPGRKKLVWISAAFPAILSPEVMGRSGMPKSFLDDIRTTDDLLSQAQVAVYSVDARGLVNTGMVGADTRDENLQFNNTAGVRNSWMLLYSQSAMKEISEQTGGKVYINRNDIDHAVSLSIADGNVYYEMAYVPQNTNWDGRFRKISAKTTRGDVTLRHRLGYYAIDPLQSGAGEKSHDAEIMSLLSSGSMSATLVIFDIRVGTLAAGNKPRIPIDTLINPHTIMCTDVERGHRCTIDYHLGVFGADGKLVAHDDQKLDATLPESAYLKAIRQGFPFHSEVEVPRVNLEVRVAVRDDTTGWMGSLKAPVKLAQ